MRKLEERLAKEPSPTRGLPPPPAHLSPRERSAWSFFAEELKDMRLDRRPDAAVLEGLCVSYARAVEADEIVSKDGIVIEGRRHPAVLISTTAWNQVRAFCSELALTPGSRARLAAAPAKADVDIEALLSSPRERRERFQ